VSSNVFRIFQQVFSWRGVWEEVPQSIKQNELKMIRLAQNVEYQLGMRGKIIMKETFNDD
jgi:hypothetical protein